MSSGAIKINGIDVREYSSAEWHRIIAYVPQEPRLLHASVADNIRFFREIDLESVQRAASLARIHDDIVHNLLVKSVHGGGDRIGPRNQIRENDPAVFGGSGPFLDPRAGILQRQAGQREIKAACAA